MADDGMMNVMPTEGIGESGGKNAPDVGRLSFLNAEWINQRVANVRAQVLTYLERIEGGLKADGFLPFQSPITDEILMRMSPDQLRMLFDTQPSLEAKANLLARLKVLKLPMPVMLPQVQPAHYSAHQLELDLEGRNPIGFEGSSV